MGWGSTYANRGMQLEEYIRVSNQIYENKGVAKIQKIATPVKILKVNRNRVEGCLDTKSTVDYTGTDVYKRQLLYQVIAQGCLDWSAASCWLRKRLFCLSVQI